MRSTLTPYVVGAVTTTSHQTNTTMTIITLLPYVKETRRYGVTYVHSAVRSSLRGWDGICGTLNGRTVRATYCGWGRSLNTPRGHKYKAHLRYTDTDKPVPSKLIDQVQPIAEAIAA